jgi:hypothetical protein
MDLSIPHGMLWTEATPDLGATFFFTLEER